jgi:hypothetical protein
MRTVQQGNNDIGWLEAFDCDVEASLDQVTSDVQIRGKIRFMLVKISNANTGVMMALHEKAKRFEKVLREVRAQVEEQDCRGDEDCDHCLIVHQTIDPALNAVAQ